MFRLFLLDMQRLLWCCLNDEKALINGCITACWSGGVHHVLAFCASSGQVIFESAKRDTSCATAPLESLCKPLSHAFFSSRSAAENEMVHDTGGFESNIKEYPDYPEYMFPKVLAASCTIVSIVLIS